MFLAPFCLRNRSAAKPRLPAPTPSLTLGSVRMCPVQCPSAGDAELNYPFQRKLVVSTASNLIQVGIRIPHFPCDLLQKMVSDSSCSSDVNQTSPVFCGVDAWLQRGSLVLVCGSS